MAKTKTRYQCTDCGAVASQWNGQCAGCKAWNTLEESLTKDQPTDGSPGSRFEGYAGSDGVTAASDVEQEELERTPTGLSELDLSLIHI